MKIPTTEFEAPPARDSRLISGVQSGLAKPIAVGVPEAPSSIPTDPRIAAETKASMDSASAALRRAGVSEAEFEPSWLQTMGAYFRNENLVGSYINSRMYDAAQLPGATPISDDEIIADLSREKLGAHLRLFATVESRQEYERRKAQLKGELEDQRIMHASGGFTGAAAMLAAGIFDLPTLLPGGIGIKGGLAGVSTARAVGGVAAAAAIDATVTEIGLQATQVSRDATDSVAAVGGSIILGGVLGAGLHRYARSALGDATVAKSEARMEGLVSDIPAARSVGAAQVDAYSAARKAEVDLFKPVPSLKAYESLEAIGKLHAGARIPMLDLNASHSASAMAARENLLFTPFISQANAEGRVLATETVQGIVRDYRRQLQEASLFTTDEFRKVKDAFPDFADFDRQVARRLVDDSLSGSVHPAVEAVAAKHREIYDKIVDRLVENKVLPAEVKTKFGGKYFPMVYDADAVRANEAEFRELFTEAFSKQFREEAQAALVEQGVRRAANDDAKAKIVGVVGRKPVVDDTGAPVINPKTGKQRQETVVLSEGEQLERDRITKTMYENEVAWQREHRELALDAHDRGTRETLEVVNGIYETSVQNATREASNLLSRSARDTNLTPSQRAKQAKEINAEQARQIAAIERERREEAKKITADRQTERRDIAKRFDDEIAAAKRVRDENLLVSKAKAKEDLSAATVGVREGLESPLRFTRNGEIAEDVVMEEARSLADRWYKSTTGYSRHTLEHEIDGFTDRLKKRRTPVEHGVLMDRGFVKVQSLDILESYVQKAGFDAALTTLFKKPMKQVGPDGKPLKDADLLSVGDLRMGVVKQDITADYDELIKQLQSSPEFKAKEAKIDEKFDPQLKAASDAGDQVTLDAILKSKQEELGKLKAEVEVRLVNQRDRDIANIDAIVDAMRGNDRSTASQALRQAVDAVGAINHMRLMGGNVLSALGDPFNIAVATQFSGAMSHGVRRAIEQFRDHWKGADGVERGLSRAGAAMAELHLNARMAAIGDLGNPHRVQGDFTDRLRQWSTRFNNLAGITYWNAFFKQVSENATTAYLGKLVLKEPDQWSKGEAAWLASLGIDADGAAVIRKAHEAQGIDRFHGDWPLLYHEQWAGQGTPHAVEAARLVRRAVGEEINNHVVTPLTTDRLSFTLTPTGRMLWQFRNHMIANQLRLVGRSVQRAQLDDNVHALAVAGTAFAGLVTIGAMVDFLKHATGQLSPIGYVDRSKSPIDRQLEEWTKTPGAALYNALDRSGVFGPVMEASNTMEKLVGFGPKTAFQIADDKDKRKEAARFRDRSAIDAVFGPAAGLANDTVNTVGNFGKLVRDGKITRSDYKQSQRLVPGQNIPYVQAIWNASQIHVGDTFAWPNPR